MDRPRKKQTLYENKTRRWCSVPQCDFEGDVRSLHKFPTDKTLRKKWIIACRIGKHVTPNMHVCSAHFCEDLILYKMLVDHSRSFNQPRKNPRLKMGATPSCNLPRSAHSRLLNKKQVSQKQARDRRAKARVCRQSKSTVPESTLMVHEAPDAMRTEDSSETTANVLDNTLTKTEACSGVDSFPVEDLSETVPIDENVATHDMNENCVLDGNCENCDVVFGPDTSAQESPEQMAALALLELQNKSEELRNQINKTVGNENLHHGFQKKSEEIQVLVNKKNKFTLSSLLKTDSDLNIFTGIKFKLLNNLAAAYRKCVVKIKEYNSLSIEERIILCLCKLKLNLSFKCIAVLFGIERRACSDNFYITLHTLAFILKSAIYWPTKNEVLQNMPSCFQKFQETFTVMDCFETPIERPKCLKCRLRLYSHYKGKETLKLLIAVAPSGLIIYISEFFGGRASDMAIVSHSKILSKLEPTRDAIMVDKGFAVETECALARIKLIIPPKLGKAKQMSVSDVKSTVEVASARVHVERTIQRVRLFEVLNGKITTTIAPYMDEICLVVCGLVNLSNSIIDDDGFPNTAGKPTVIKKKKSKVLKEKQNLIVNKSLKKKQCVKQVFV